MSFYKINRRWADMLTQLDAQHTPAQSKMLRMLIANIALTTALLLFTCGSIYGQIVSGNITGSIYDATGGSVPNARVVIRNDATGVEAATLSASDGQYHLSNLAVGTYTVQVEAEGFMKTQLKGVNVELNGTATANLTLQVGRTVESIEVTAAAAALETTSSQLQNTYEARQMMELPNASTGSGVLNL